MLQAREVALELRHRVALFRRQAEVGVQRQVDQRRQFRLGQRQRAALLFELAGRLDQRTLVAERLHRVANALPAHVLAVVPGLGHAAHQAVDLGQQALRRDRPPIGRAHVLGDGVDDLAAPFLEDQALVGLLLGTDVADTEVQYVPDHGQVRHFTVAVLGGRRLQGLGTGLHALAARSADIVAPGVAGFHGHAWQHVEARQVDLALGQGFFHDLKA